MESVDQNEPDGSEGPPNSVGVDGPFEAADPHEELERILGTGCNDDGLKEAGRYNQVSNLSTSKTCKITQNWLHCKKLYCLRDKKNTLMYYKRTGLSL